MRKIQELIKNGKLSENLMSNEEFINGAKEIFKSENIEMDNEKLAQLISQIETKLQKTNILNDKELEQISGGVSGKAIARGIIKTVTTVISGYTGVMTGGCIGFLPGAAIASAKSEDAAELIGGPIGYMAGALTGSYYGGRLGLRFGNYICKTLGLNEE